MSRQVASVLSTLSISSIVLVIGACTAQTAPAQQQPESNSDQTTPTKDKKKTSSSSSTGSSDSTGSSSPSGSSSSSATGSDAGGTAADAKCAKEATNSACGDCCIAAHDAGNKAFDAAFLACSCGAQGACQTECATTVCAATIQNPDATCDACLRKAFDTGGACADKQAAACQKNADCAALEACLGTCPAQ